MSPHLGQLAALGAASCWSISALAFQEAGKRAVFFSRSITDSEELILTNTSGRALTAIWRVFLFSDTRNSYSQTVSVQ